MKNNFYRAVFLILLAILLFDIQGAIIKKLGKEFSIPQIAFYRNLFGLIPSLILLFMSASWQRGQKTWRLPQWRLAVLRGVSIFFAQFCFYLSLTKMELATATTIAFAGPLFITLLSIPILRHHVGSVRIIAVLTGFAGIVMVMQPGSDVFQWLSLLPVAAAFGYAFSSVLVKLFDDSAETALINVYTSIVALICTLALMLGITEYVPPPTIFHWGWLILLGSVGGTAVFTMIAAYRLTQPSNLSPFEYFGIPFSFILGWLFFDEAPFDKLIPGVFLIVAGGLIILWRERRIQKETQ